jgi:hypothetical protein
MHHNPQQKQPEKKQIMIKAKLKIYS